MEQRLIDINKIKEVTLEDSLSILTYTPDNGVRCNIEADTVFTIPENPTNGDMIKALFPNSEEFLGEKGIGFLVGIGKPDGSLLWFPPNWWNAPYKEEEK